MAQIKILLFVPLQLVFVLSINAQVLKYTSVQTYLRAKPGFNSVRVASLSKGTKINLSKNHYKEWIPINYEGLVAYLYSGFLTGQNPNSSRLYKHNLTPFKHRNRTGYVKKYYINSRG